MGIITFYVLVYRKILVYNKTKIVYNLFKQTLQTSV